MFLLKKFVILVFLVFQNPKCASPQNYQLFSMKSVDVVE